MKIKTKTIIFVTAFTFLFSSSISPVGSEVVIDGNGMTIGINIRESFIGVSGKESFGLGPCPTALLPSGFKGVKGYSDPTHDNYGNYQYVDGSIMVFIPKYYYKVGTGANGLAVNVIDVKGTDAYVSTATANADGYALHRAFIDGGGEKAGFFIDEYACSNNGGTASSIKNGRPISMSASYNPIASLDACAANASYETINAAHGRGAIFNVASRFMYSALAMLSMAHGQVANGTTDCAWYDGGGTTNFPKGCNSGGLGDVNDGTVSYAEDTAGSLPKTGSGSPFAKTTHNGQNCGVSDLNGVIMGISLGLTRPGANATDGAQQNDDAAFYVLKESVALKDLQSGWHSGAAGANYEAWGDAAHLAVYYDQIAISQFPTGQNSHRFGSGANQVLSEATSGDNWIFTGIGFPKDNSGNDGTGTALFGEDGYIEKQVANMIIISNGSSFHTASAGVWYVFPATRTLSNALIGFRCGCYSD